ncbi:FAD-dependent oxidoreductase [Ectothiorhodospiraceae bacterium BW-2]|nr:FAD-dependent oxidoreductase [Ectothiorhodospiraceae bacterium BW-2]
MAKTYEVAIIGAGLIGLLTARELSRAGVSVVVLERQQAGRESTWAGGGIISPLYPWRYPEAVSALASWGQQHYQELCRQLTEESGTDPQWQRSGLLIPNLDESERQRALQWCQRWQNSALEVDAKEMAKLEPLLATEALTTGLYLPEVAQLRNSRLSRALVKSTERSDIDLKQHWPVSGIESRGGCFYCRNSLGEQIAAAQVVLCGGAWSGELGDLAGESLSVAPVKGQMIAIPLEPEQIKRITLIDGHYFIPRRDGLLLVGSTLEPEAGFDKQISHAAAEELQRLAWRYLPALNGRVLRYHWAGLRPGSENRGIPFIGKSRITDGIWYNCGHFRNGVVLGAASARLLADLLLQRQPQLASEPYRINSDATMNKAKLNNITI